MKVCNGGYCDYKTFGSANPLCSYDGYCDYQCPKDSRGLGVVNNSIICDHSLTYEDSSGKHCSKCGQQLI